MAVSEQAPIAAQKVDSDTRKPPMTPLAILLMNFGFFGIQFSFGLQQSAVNPIFTFIGAKPEELPLLNLAGPVTGLVIQPLIGAASDRTWGRFGRRKPYFIIGALGCMVMLFLFPFVGAIWTAFLFMWLLDASNNTAMEPYRAFISDRLPKNQLARGFLVQSMFVGLGAVSANLSLLIFQKLITGITDHGIPFWVYVCFWIGAVCSIGSVLVSVLTTKEIPPTEEELAEMRAKKGGPAGFFAEISSAVREMPVGMHKIGLVFLFQWFAMAVYWQFVAVSMTEKIPAFASTDPAKPVSEAASGWVGAVNGMYNLITIFAALALIPIAQKFGAKRVGAVALVFGGVGLLVFANLNNQYALLVPEIGVGIAWASMLGIPYIMVASMVPKERSGVYMGIVNMMIVVPMLIQNVTFGWIFEHLLGGSGANAIMLSGALLLCAAIAMLWINPPPDDEESALMPLGAARAITIYDKVVVGSDGTPSSLYAVDRAHAVAAEADAQVVVVSAYSPADATDEGARKELHGREAAFQALEVTVRHLTSDRVRRIEQRVVAGDPAQALLSAAEGNPHNLIVVGNRGLGAEEGQMLGTVPAAVVKDAVCDVLIVQGTRDRVPRNRR
ncbi:MFS transporter [uncultured Friedmanniella sp.]|uniref:MFS transporter n=1 Tax=uncultured Friedmanniella sp. TaxID=335381 RepID=UPI0035CB62BE